MILTKSSRLKWIRPPRLPLGRAASHTSAINETKSRYGGILDNIGCICRVLLSLNIEPCCVIPSHASNRSRHSYQSDRSDVSSKSLNNANSAKQSVQFADTLQPNFGGSNNCCGDNNVPSPKTAIKPNTSSCESQCSDIDGRSALKDENYSDSSGCGDQTEKKVDDDVESFCLQAFLGRKSDAVSKPKALKRNHCDGDGCCEEENKHDDETANTSPEDCSTGG